MEVYNNTLGITNRLASTDLRMEDLLQAQFKNQASLSLCNNTIKVNLQLFLYQINKKYVQTFKLGNLVLIKLLIGSSSDANVFLVISQYISPLASHLCYLLLTVLVLVCNLSLSLCILLFHHDKSDSKFNSSSLYVLKYKCIPSALHRSLNLKCETEIRVTVTNRRPSLPSIPEFLIVFKVRLATTLTTGFILPGTVGTIADKVRTTRQRNNDHCKYSHVCGHEKPCQTYKDQHNAVTMSIFGGLI